MLFNSRVSAASEKDIEERKNNILDQTIKVATSQLYAGSFSMPQWSQTKSGASLPQWYSCRESFQSIFKKNIETIAFSHKPKTGENIATFIRIFEDKLKLKKNRTTFFLTDKNNILLVNPSAWWRKYLIRRSLFTILLRAAQAYDIKKDNFEEALYSNDYSRETKAAINLFLKRYTLVKTAHINSGWRNTFRNKGEKKILEILIKPPKKRIVESTIPPATSEDSEQKNCFDNEMLEKARRVRVS